MSSTTAASALNDIEVLRHAVLDADEMHRRVHSSCSAIGSSHSSVLSCAKRRQESARLAAKVAEHLAEFERSVSFSGARRFSESKFFTDAKLAVPVAELNKPSDMSNGEPLLRLQKAVLRLSDVHGKVVQRAATAATSGAGGKENTSPTRNASNSLASHPSSEFYATHRFLNERAPELLGKVLEHFRSGGASGLQGEAWASIPDSMLVLLDDVITAATTASVLLDSEESMRRTKFSVEELSHQQGEAIAEGDMRAAEELYFKKVMVQESMVPLFEAMGALLDEHHAAVVMEPAERAQQVHARANGEISALAAKHETRKKALDGDLRTLTALQRQLSDEDRELRSRFVRLRTDSDAYLKENLSETERCYKAMEELERHVARLAAERSDALSRRIAADVQEAQRVADLENFYAFAKQHRLLLETSLRTVESSEEVTDLFHELVSSGCNAAGQRIRALESGIEATRLRLQEERLSQFRNLYLTLGDLQYKKERNLEELDKKIEQVHIQQEIAMDTFNPKAKELANAKRELLQVRDEIVKNVQVIAGKAQLQIEAFKPTEEALITAGKQFLHPVTELAQKNDQRQQKMLEYHQLMTARTDDPSAIVVGGAPVEEEVKALEELRQKVTSGRYHQAAGNSPIKSSRPAVVHASSSTSRGAAIVDPSTTSVPGLD